VETFNTNASGNDLTIVNGTGQQITYSFDQANKQLTRPPVGTHRCYSRIATCLTSTYSNAIQAMISGCRSLRRGNWTQRVKVVQLSWKTARTLPNGLINSENIQTARIVIRKQAD
jgi:hypothetical protein